MITLRIQAADAIIVKCVEHGEVKTQTVINGKVTLTERKDIKRLGYKTTEELIETLKAQGYEVCESH